MNKNNRHEDDSVDSINCTAKKCRCGSTSQLAIETVP